MDTKAVGEFLERFADLSESVYWLSDPSLSKIVYISRAYEDIWGRDREVLYRFPEKWISYLHPDDVTGRHPIHAFAERVHSEGKDARYSENYRIVRPDGEIRYILDRGFPIFIDGVCLGVTGFAADITEIKLREKALEESIQKVELANFAKSDFIANMSHDIRTPITGMLGMVQDLTLAADHAEQSLASGKDPNGLLKEMVSTVRRDGHHLTNATNQLLHLCNEILELTRLECGQSQKHEDTFSLCALIQDNLALLMPTAKHKNLLLTMKTDPSLPDILTGSRVYLDRILLNLVGNALKFTHKGHVRVVVALDAEHDQNLVPGSTVRLKLTVEDSGIGIPKDKFDVIFEHFSQLTPSHHGLYKGAGLGLYTVKRFVKAMSGTIALESVVGRGTTFEVTLPFIVAEQKTVPDASRPLSVTPCLGEDLAPILSPRPRSSLGNTAFRAFVLVVEDNELAAFAVRFALERLHCRVEVACNGHMALNKIDAADYDLVLMDIGLPDIDGIEVTKKIRVHNDIQKAAVPVVALTGHAALTEGRQALAAGMQKVICKPAHTADLAAVLNQFVAPMENV